MSGTAIDSQNARAREARLLSGLDGGAEGIRTSDLRSAGTRAVDGAAACASAVTASCGYPIREKRKSRGPRLSLDVDSRRWIGRDDPPGTAGRWR